MGNKKRYGILCALIMLLLVPSLSSAETSDAGSVLADEYKRCAQTGEYDTFIAHAREMLIRQKAADIRAAVLLQIAQARIEQVDRIARKDDLESFRVYLQVNDMFYREALDCLEECLSLSPSLEMRTNALILQMRIWHAQFNEPASTALAHDLVRMIEDEKSESGKVLRARRLSERLAKEGLIKEAGVIDDFYFTVLARTNPHGVAAEMQERAGQLFEQKEYAGAAALYSRVFDILLPTAASESISREATIVAGRFFEVKEYEQAIPFYLLAAENATDPVVGEGGLFFAAKANELLQRSGEAMAIYERILAMYPEGQNRQEVLKSLIMIASLSERYDLIITCSDDLMSVSGDDTKTIEWALSQKGTAAFRSGNNVVAQETFQRLVDESPGSVYASTARRYLEQIAESEEQGREIVTGEPEKEQEEGR